MDELRATVVLDDFLASRVGARYRARRFSYAMPNEGLSLGVAIGRFEMEDVRALAPLLDAVRSFPPHVALWDGSRLDEFSHDAFVELERLFRARAREELAVEKVAIIGPQSGQLRAVAAGLFAFLEPPYPVSAFPTVSEAMAWLGRDVPEAGALIEHEAEALAFASFDGIVAAWLDAHVAEIDIEHCARDVGVSVRTLQRRLGERGLSFEHEANAARVRAAEQRLATDASLTTIAYESGFSSPQRFTTVFRQLRGETPSEARLRLRVAPHEK